MRLTDEERAMHGGELSEPRRWAIDHMLKVGAKFDASDFRPVSPFGILMTDTCINYQSIMPPVMDE